MARDKAFDGVLSGTGALSNGLIGSGTESTLTINPPVSGTKIEALVVGDYAAYNASYTAGHTVGINGQPLNLTNSTATYLAEANLSSFELTGATSLQSITAGDQNLVGVRVDGLVLIDGVPPTELTLASSKDFTGDTPFESGDEVQQDSGHTPTTSVITGYSQESYPDLGAAGNWVGPAASSGANLFNKEPEGTHTGTYVYNTSNATPITWTAPLNGKLKGSGSVFLGWQSRYTGATEYYGTICRITTQAGTFDSAGSTPGGITEVVLGDNYEIEKLEFIGKSGNSYNGGLSWISPTADEASKWYSGMEVTTLTLQDDTDLENFRVGDIISQSAPGSANAGPWPSGFRYTDGGGAGGIDVYWNRGNNIVVTSGDTHTTITGGKYTPLVVDTGLLGDHTLTFTRTSSSPNNLSVATTDDPDQGWTSSRVYFATNGTAPLTLSSTPGNRTANNQGNGVAYGRYWMFYGQGSADVNFTITGTAQSPASGTIIAIDLNANTITTDSDSFYAGDPLTGPDTTPATGTVASTDSGAKTMVLGTSDETYPKRWIANQGKYVIGKEYPSGDAAPDPDGVNFIGTNFVGTEATMTHASSDWQVAEFADTTYSSPTSEVTDDPAGSPPPSWTSGELKSDTKYRSRVRYKSTNGVVSEWSDDRTFETSKGEQTIQARPGVIYQVNKDNFAVTTPYPGAYTSALSINCIERYGSGTQPLLQVTVDGQLYQSGLLVVRSEIDGKCVSICAGYNTGALVLLNDGKVYYIDTNNVILGAITNKSRDAKCINVLGFGNSSQQFAAVYEDGHIIIFNGSDGAIINEGNWGPSNTPVAMGCYSGTAYEADHVLVLTDDGKLYKTAVQATLSGSRLCPGLTREGTFASPVELPPSHDPTKRWIEVCNAGTEPGFGITAATEDGKIYASLKGDKVSPTNVDYSWQQVPNIDNAISSMQSRRSAGAGVTTKKFLYVGDDKALYKVEGSGFTPTKSLEQMENLAHQLLPSTTTLALTAIMPSLETPNVLLRTLFLNT